MFQVPETFEAAEGWQFYMDAPTWDATNVGDLAPGDGSPEAAVVHFYASRVRGDARWEEVLPTARDERLGRKLERMADWHIKSLRLLARKERSPKRWYVKVALDLVRDGKAVAFKDDVTVEREGERWVVARPPS